MIAAATLAEQATEALQSGDLAAAQEGFARAASAHAAAGDGPAASIGFRLAALVAMLAGRPADAEALAERSLGSCEDDHRARFAALVALAEVHRLAGRAAEAEQRLDAAIELADHHAAAGGAVASDLERGALLRRRAGVRHAQGKTREAVGDLQRAAHDLAAAGEVGSAAATELELFGVLHDASAEAALDALATARVRAAESGAPAVRAQVDAVDGSAALALGDVRRARELFTSARDAALVAVDAATYLAAVSGLAAAAEQQGDRHAAYATLVTAWATISDLLGREVAAAAIRPQLLGLRSRWGEPDFAAVKDAHDAARRAALGDVAGRSVS